ncbi:hypothetical protein ACEQ8H_000226 [Pleosporales sp. CAS-2024a]
MSVEAILQHKLDLKYDPSVKDRSEPHTLCLEPVPPLPIGTKPLKNDGDSSTQASSPIRDTVPTPDKPEKKAQTTKPPTTIKKQPPMPTIGPVSTAKMISITKGQIAKASEVSPGFMAQQGFNEDLRARVFSKPLPTSTSTELPCKFDKKLTDGGDNPSILSTYTAKRDTAKAMEASIISHIASSNKEGVRPGDVKTLEKPMNQPVEEKQPNTNGTATVVVPKPHKVLAADISATKSSSLAATVSTPTFRAINKTTSTMVPPKTNLQVVIPPAKEDAVPQSSTIAATPATPKRPTPAAETPVTPANQVQVGWLNGCTADSKRAKLTHSPSPAVIAPRILSGSSSPRPMSVERKVAESRKKLEAVRQKRLEAAKRQEEVDRKLDPYKQRMAEELERLEREMREEEAAAKEDEEHFEASMAMLAEFESVE